MFHLQQDISSKPAPENTACTGCLSGSEKENSETQQSQKSSYKTQQPPPAYGSLIGSRGRNGCNPPSYASAKNNFKESHSDSTIFVRFDIHDPSKSLAYQPTTDSNKNSNNEKSDFFIDVEENKSKTFQNVALVKRFLYILLAFLLLFCVSFLFLKFCKYI